MEFLFLVPIVICIILFLLLKRERKNRKKDILAAQIRIDETNTKAAKEIKEHEAASKLAIKNIEENAKNRIAIAKSMARNVEEEAAFKVSQAYSNAKDDIEQVKAQTTAKIVEMHEKAEQRIREEREAIHLEKERFRSMPDKDLMIECMYTLGTFAQRLDRLENRMSNIAISLDGIIRKSTKEKKPYTHIGKITDADFLNIVNEASKRVDRITDFTVNNAVIRGTFVSHQKLSTYSFEIDFNDDGHLTGHYTIISENYDSTVPNRFALEISKEIVYRLNM